MLKAKKQQKVIVAMSGGLDSSVAAALLKRAGPAPEQARYGVNFEVVGVFMKFWLAPEKDGLIGAWNRCCSPEAEKRAREVADKLGIPFYVFNFEDEFKKRIVDYFLAEYQAGRTPNPCVVCNKEIKFGLLLEKALALNADFVATGHYARLRREIQSPKSKIQNYQYKLLRAKDKTKDQSYFLWQLNQNQLKHILFPIGDYTKTQVRNLAKKFKLPVWDIPESQEICFVKTSVNDFLHQYLKEKPGQIIEKSELPQKVLGEHQGLAFYTIGQRKGIGLSEGPCYVLAKDIKNNLLIVTKEKKDLAQKELIAKEVNWLSGKVPQLPLKIEAKIRYQHQPAKAVITADLKSKTYRLKFNQAQLAITPGQSVVFYLPAEASAKAGEGQELLGGGIIN